MESEYESVYKDFIAFVEDLARRDDTWKFWYGFVFHDSLAYDGLYRAIYVAVHGAFVWPA